MENEIVKKQDAEQVHELINEQVNKTDDVKAAIDLFATATALKQEETLNKVVEEKQEELRNDAEAKRVEAETERIAKQTEKAKQEKEKELAELDKLISKKKSEVDKLKADSDIATAYFESNKDILKYIGVREKKSMGVMQFLIVPAIIVFIIVQILLFPFTFCGLLLETIVEIIGGICGAVKSNALRIITSIAVILFLAGVAIGAYYLLATYVF